MLLEFVTIGYGERVIDMSFSERYAKKRSKWDPKFKELTEDSKAVENHELRAQLISLRLELGLTQKEFADLVKVKQPLISRLENGSHNITINKLQDILERTNTGARLKIETNENKIIHR